MLDVNTPKTSPDLMSEPKHLPTQSQHLTALISYSFLTVFFCLMF